MVRVQSKKGWFFFSFREKVFLWHLAVGRFAVSWDRKWTG